MRHFVFAALVVCLNAQAQSIDLNLGGMRAGVHVHGAPAPLPPQTTVIVAAPAQPPVRVVGAEQFRIDYTSDGFAQVTVVSPEGLLAQVWTDEGEFGGSYSVPFVYQGKQGYCRVILSDANGVVVFDRKVELRQFNQTVLSLRVAAPPPQVVQPVVVAAAPIGPVAMAASDFEALLGAVKAESFSGEKLDVIRTATDHDGYFTCVQVGQLIDLLTMGSDKVEVVAITRRHLVDSNNAFTLSQRFTFSSDKEKVRAMLARQ